MAFNEQIKGLFGSSIKERCLSMFARYCADFSSWAIAERVMETLRSTSEWIMSEFHTLNSDNCRRKNGSIMKL